MPAISATENSQPPDADFTVLPPAPTRFKTNLQLTSEQRDALRDRCVTRIAELQREMGLNDDGSVEGAESWMGRRKRYQDLCDNDNSWRKVMYGGVFDISNLTLGTAQRFVREMHAKAADDLLGTRPFFAAVKNPDMGDDETARAIEELLQQHVDRSSVQIELRSALHSALIRNECVVKIRWIRRSTPYYGPAVVMIGPDGEPIRTPNGLMIYENDDFLPDPDVEGLFRLKKDPLFAMSLGQFPYKAFERLKQELLQYEGIETREVDFRSFLCPLRCPSIHEADMAVQLYDDTPQRIREYYGEYEGFDDYWRGSFTDEGSGEMQAKETHGEQSDGGRSLLNVYRRMAECYVRFDADGDGFEEEIFVVLDRSCGEMAYYEYLANVMPMRPFEAIPGAGRVANRWYGEGVVQAVIDQDTYIDAQFNRFNVKDGKENSITFRDPMAVREWQNGAQIEFNTDKVYDVTPGYDKENRPPVWRANLSEKSEIGLQLLEIAQQQVNLMFGVISAKDASATDLNNSRTATGILNIERTSNVLIKNSEIQHQEAVIRIMGQVVTVVLENIRDTELLLSKDGKMLLTINREEARTIEREIRLLLTRSRSSELLSTNAQALAVAEKYHAMRAQMPQVARTLRALFLSQLKALEVADPDELCPSITDEEIAAWKQQSAEAAEESLRRQSRETISYKDCPDSIKAQWEAACKFVPATPEEREKKWREEFELKNKGMLPPPDGYGIEAAPAAQTAPAVPPMQPPQVAAAPEPEGSAS